MQYKWKGPKLNISIASQQERLRCINMHSTEQSWSTHGRTARQVCYVLSVSRLARVGNILGEMALSQKVRLSHQVRGKRGEEGVVGGDEHFLAQIGSQTGDEGCVIHFLRTVRGRFAGLQPTITLASTSTPKEHVRHAARSE